MFFRWTMWNFGCYTPAKINMDCYESLQMKRKIIWTIHLHDFGFKILPPRKLTWQSKIDHLKMHFVLNMVFSNVMLFFPGCKFPPVPRSCLLVGCRGKKPWINLLGAELLPWMHQHLRWNAAAWNHHHWLPPGKPQEIAGLIFQGFLAAKWWWIRTSPIFNKKYHFQMVSCPCSSNVMLVLRGAYHLWNPLRIA